MPPSVIAAGVEVDDDAVASVLDMARRRAAGEPLQYLTGIAGFRWLELEVGPGVFVPRPETELVAERAMSRLPRGGVLVDVGTGSGAIALSVAHERPDARVYATESSPDALEWARRNVLRLDLHVALCAGDLLDGLEAGLQGRIDVIVSNPPYVAVSEEATLPAEVRDHEPFEALFARGSGVAVIERLACAAPRWLRPDGWLVTEIGETQAEDVAALLAALGYRNVEVGRDLAGRARVALGVNP